MGIHNIEFSVAPHVGTFQDAEIVREAYDFNCPLRVVEADSAISIPDVPLLQLAPASLVISTIKPLRGFKNTLVVRLYESLGSRGMVS